jgi:hypothetical protein
MEQACQQHLRNTVSTVAVPAVEFEFIVSNSFLEAAKSDQNTFRTIRRHAMRHHLLRKKLSVDCTLTQTNKPAVPPEGGTVGRFKLSSWSRKSRKGKRNLEDESPSYTTPSRKKVAELGAINVLPIDVQLRTHELLWHCKYADIDCGDALETDSYLPGQTTMNLLKIPLLSTRTAAGLPLQSPMPRFCMPHCHWLLCITTSHII